MCEDGTERCDECDGAVVETAAGRECEDCKKRFRPPVTDGGKMSVSGENPEERAKIPYELADGVRRSVEVFGR